MSYHISAPDEYLAVTGMGIRTVGLAAAALHALLGATAC
jgi:hypothetical protein